MKLARSLLTIGALAGFGVLLASTPRLQAADHIDSEALAGGPSTDADPGADIADLYAFVSPSDSSKAVLVMTVAPLDPASDADRAEFDDTVRYDFNVDTNADDDADTIQVDHKYSVRTKGGMVRVMGNGVDIQGAQGTVLEDSAAGVKFYAGPRDDPFFINLSGLIATIRTGTASFSDPQDTVATTNVAAIVLELPKSLLQNGGSNTKLNVWATTVR